MINLSLFKHIRRYFPHFYFSNNNHSQQQASYYKTRKNELKNHSYPHFYPTITISAFKHKYNNLKQAATSQQLVAGRISSIRKHGKTTFIDIRSQHQKIQLAFQGKIEHSLNRGDIIGVKGEPFITKTGELSLKVKNLQLLSPCLWMLPDHESLDDQQTRYRKRHIDLITNRSSLQKLKTRSKIISFLREYLGKLKYMQVQTPILSLECGGAIAKPFKTFHNDHKMEMFMRIAPELYLKKLLIGGVDKVYEIGKNFRNQSIDQTHNPQFTSCQLYSSYSDYLQMKQFTQELISGLVKQIVGSYQIKKPGTQLFIDVTPPWKTIDFIPQLQRQINTQFPNQFNSQQSLKFLINVCKSKGIILQQQVTAARLLDKLSSKFLQHLGDPLFIMNHPRIMSPLAKRIKDRPQLTQRFELFINGWEIVNSYTELNDPSIQRQNTPSDVDYIQALEYGLMPCAGWGMGIDRLVMLLTQSERIQQVIAFPLLKEK